VPHWIEQSSRPAPYTALGTAFDRGLKIFIKRHTPGMEGFTASNRAANGSDTPGIDANASSLAYIFNNSAGGCVYRI